jgi:hypothetical protein
MNAIPDPSVFQTPAQAKRPNVLRRLLHALAVLISSPRGDMGGWECGARGL